MKIYVKAATSDNAHIDYLDIIKNQKNNEYHLYDPSDYLLKNGNGLSPEAFKVFIKLVHGDHFNLKSWTAEGCKEALERYISVIPEGKIHSQISLGPYGRPIKLMKCIRDILENRGYNVRCGKGYYGRSSTDWKIVYSSDPDDEEFTALKQEVEL